MGNPVKLKLRLCSSRFIDCGQSCYQSGINRVEMFLPNQEVNCQGMLANVSRNNFVCDIFAKHLFCIIHRQY